MADEYEEYEERVYRHADEEQEEQEEQPPVEVPAEVLSEEALSALIDSFIWREGTDYGTQEVAHETKVRQVRHQVENGEVKIVFDPNTETATLMTAREFKKRSAPQF